MLWHKWARTNQLYLRICKALSCTPNDIISFEDTCEKEILN